MHKKSKKIKPASPETNLLTLKQNKKHNSALSQ